MIEQKGRYGFESRDPYLCVVTESDAGREVFAMEDGLDGPIDSFVEIAWRQGFEIDFEEDLSLDMLTRCAAFLRAKVEATGAVEREPMLRVPVEAVATRPQRKPRKVRARKAA